MKCSKENCNTENSLYNPFFCDKHLSHQAEPTNPMGLTAKDLKEIAHEVNEDQRKIIEKSN